MQIFDLSPGWKCRDENHGGGDPAAMSQPGCDVSGWHDIRVPGDVNAMLVACGRMPDPRLDDNARRCYWVTARDWWFRREFVPPVTPLPRADLCLDGIDGFAAIYLNGKALARTENAFRPFRLGVERLLKPGEPNVLLLHFRSIDSIMGGPRADELAGWRDRRTCMRKPQFSFGWDWSLPLPSIGVTGNVRIEYHDGARLIDFAIRGNSSGRVDCRWQVSRAARDRDWSLAVRLRGHGFSFEQQFARPGRSCSYAFFGVKSPALWWPNGAGQAALYDYEAELLCEGRTVDRRTGRMGFREVRILEEPFTPGAGPGISFWLEINGKRVFCKGANWVPLEIWPATAEDGQYRFYLQKTAEANFNIQRVWGGGIYERDLFYDLCDELGIMVWQDFMFASAGYPLERLRHEIIAEAEYQIKRLRNHPSIALWCGCNEDVFSWPSSADNAGADDDTGVYSQAEDNSEINRARDDPQIYSMILRGLVGKLGHGVPYVESSPQSHDDFGNAPESGNCHISCWKYILFNSGSPPTGTKMPSMKDPGYFKALCAVRQPEEFRRHFERTCSFDSEFCIQGPCAAASLKGFLSPPHHWPPDDVWTFHIQRGHALLTHHDQTMFIAGRLFGQIDSLQKYVKHGQAAHAEMMRAEFESARRDRPNNGGTMVWMFNDCWPTSNWSIIDYYRRPKPAYYAARRACAPLLPIVMERGGMVEFFFSNDSLKPCAAELRFGLETLAGRQLWVRETRVQAEACSTAAFFSIERRALDCPADGFLFIEASLEDAALPKIAYFPNLWKDVPWPVPRIRVEMLDRCEREGAWTTVFRISTDVYARFCHILPAGEQAHFWADDNFFDLCAGTAHLVACRSAAPLDPGLVRTGHWLTDWP